MNSTIYLIRHSTTSGNIGDWYYGALDVPLVPEGIEKLEKLKDEGIYPSPEDADIYTSGMLRTEQTLETIYGKVPHRVIEEFREYNFGIFEGKTYEELVEMPEFPLFHNDTTNDYVIPEGESRNIFEKRVLLGWNKLLGFHRLKELSHRHSGLDAVSIVICHGGVIDRIMHSIFGTEDDLRYQWTPDTGRGYAIEFVNSDPVSYKAL